MRTALGVLLLCASAAHGAESVSPACPPGALSPPRAVRDVVITLGESLEFLVRWGVIPGGTAVLAVAARESAADGRAVYRFEARVHSNQTLDTFFMVRDRVVARADAASFTSISYRKELREGRHKYDTDVRYDSARGVAHVDIVRYQKSEPLQVRETERFSVCTPPGVMDVLSALYFIRTQDLVPGRTFSVPTHEKRRIYDLMIEVQARERVQVRAGTFDTLRIEPKLEEEGLFRQKGRLLVWVTDDARRIPVMMKSEVRIGAITAELLALPGAPPTPRAQE